MLSRQTNRDIKECFFAPVGWFGLLTVHILSYIKSLTPMAFGTHPLTVSWKQHEPLCVCVWTCIQLCFQVSMETYKNVNMLLYLLCVWAGLDPSQAYWISQLGSRGEAEDWIYIYWLCSGSVKPCRSSWFSDQREARESFFSSCC